MRRLGAWASYNVGPLDSTVYETIESELITLAGKFPLNNEKCRNVAVEVKALIRIGHFRVTFGLCVKTSLRAKPFI